MTKKDIEVLLACVEAAKVSPEAMIPVGMAYQNAKRVLQEMQEGDVLIVFTPNQGKEPGESKPEKNK